MSKIHKEIPKDGIIGGGKFNQPHFVNEKYKEHIVQGITVNGGYFHGKYSFKNCTLRNVSLDCSL